MSQQSLDDQERSSLHSELVERQTTIETLLRKEQETLLALERANAELNELRDKVGNAGDVQENKIYSLNRALIIASDLNKEHANALAIAAKRMIRLEECIKIYKHSVRDVAKSLGETLNSLVIDPVTKEELESIHLAAVEATPDAPDAIFTLRISERISSAVSFLDQELQLALADVPPRIRELLKKIPNFEEALFRHSRSASSIHSDSLRLLSSVDEACSIFEFEFESIQPDEI